ncbi:DUF4041 domain-containing protein [Aurantimicrobium minutum]|uniref:DUF4041 domain-containing protein n=1 Tax=Aurantimicrobium minutum TaxID=708131 RepID=UPI00248E7F2D|nr:DUF4041 domain-containing protein [Aurantimicrobium minutum]
MASDTFQEISSFQIIQNICGGKMSEVPAGWYPNPEDASTYLYWDGTQWIGEPKSEQDILGTTENTAAFSSAPEPIQREEVKVGLFGGKKAAQAFADEAFELKQELAQLKSVVDKYGIADDVKREQERSSLLAEIKQLETRIHELTSEEAELKAVIDQLKEEIVDLRSQAGLQELGLYDYEHPAETSVELSGQLEQIKADIKKVISSKTATNATNNFTFNNSAKEGAKFVKDMSALLLRAYNAEAENCVKGAKAGNEEANVKRLITAMNQIERQGKTINLSITSQYHRLRLKEIELATKYLKVLAEEKEAEREHRAQLREDAKVARELEREMKKLTDNQQMLETTLAKAQANGDQEAIEKTLARIEEVKKNIEDVNARAANRRMGHVYVISNIGAFGKDVVKIGMTRRMDPLDRVRELGDASVPFRFDLHAMIFSEDAVALETNLHRKFESKRINKINAHREFFRVTPAEVLKELQEENVVVVSYVVEPEAAEYRASIGEIDPSKVEIDDTEIDIDLDVEGNGESE